MANPLSLVRTISGIGVDVEIGDVVQVRWSVFFLCVYVFVSRSCFGILGYHAFESIKTGSVLQCFTETQLEKSCLAE